MDVVNETSQGLFLSRFAAGIEMEQQPQHRISRSIFQTLETLLQRYVISECPSWSFPYHQDVFYS